MGWYKTTPGIWSTTIHEDKRTLSCYTMKLLQMQLNCLSWGTEVYPFSQVSFSWSSATKLITVWLTHHCRVTVTTQALSLSSDGFHWFASIVSILYRSSSYTIRATTELLCIPCERKHLNAVKHCSVCRSQDKNTQKAQINIHKSLNLGL